MGVGQKYFEEHLKNKSFDEILINESIEVYTNKAALKLVMLTFIAKSTEMIVKSFDNHKNAMIKNSESNDKLSLRILWLNIILGFFTIAGTIFGAIALFK